ncbi:MAG: bifunctional indole-3-glycerol-phosphate synthase TrpC/phosphoribosylanthranilate isomerase TrpF [Pseudomonadota bacterium]|nr:bifunctional indole-3-glycerol-phosphate synthase TrpC/phosphoribosylanthranilate isomerase TrpF [Pseudomonadota bacterium]
MADGVLGKILEAKRVDLAARYASVSLDSLRQRAQPTRRSLAAVIARPGSRFILEIKRASPSQGSIRASADPERIARGYAPVADALSVLTDGAFFGGSLDDLSAARRVFDGPILAKDFFIDLRQVAEARIAGADAILVMLSVLGDSDARAMIGEARRLGMDALVEVHDEQEMRRALALGAPLIGINNRNLRDLSVDLATTERLARMAPGRLLVSESGIGTRADVQRLSKQVDGFLVGTSLMRASDPAQAARELVFGRVKLCGLNRRSDIAAGAAASFAGFVFVPGSVRHITADGAAPLAGAARKLGMLPVGVFRDAPVAVVADIATLLNLHAVQLHGQEDVAYSQTLRRQLPRECEVWTAVSVGRDHLSRAGGDRLLFDNGDGGTGRSFDWRMVGHHPALGTSLVAGGIGPGNARAARMLGAYAIDCGSALDAAPGAKSPEKIRALFDALRADGRQGIRQCA